MKAKTIVSKHFGITEAIISVALGIIISFKQLVQNGSAIRFA